MKTLLYCPDLGRANIIRSRLESEGITAAVVNENATTTSLAPVVEAEGIRILVDEADFDRAAEIIQDTYGQPPVFCPRCSSPDVQVADASHVNPFSEAIRRIFHGTQQRYTCRHCGYTFYKDF